MDTYSINLGGLFENRYIATLSAEVPLNHSVHCLIDVPHCMSSPFEVMTELENKSFGRACKCDTYPYYLTISL